VARKWPKEEQQVEGYGKWMYENVLTVLISIYLREFQISEV
jgi:hypothetical protein